MDINDLVFASMASDKKVLASLRKTFVKVIESDDFSKALTKTMIESVKNDIDENINDLMDECWVDMQSKLATVLKKHMTISFTGEE